MTSRILIDSNVFIYVIGRDHPLREPCRRVLALADGAPSMFFTDVEVFQELLHRYLSMRTWTSVQPYVRDLLQVMAGRIEPVEESDVQQAMALADELQDIDARDLLHAAVMTRVGARRICSADRGFDRLPGIERLDPALVEEWERLLEAPES